DASLGFKRDSETFSVRQGRTGSKHPDARLCRSNSSLDGDSVFGVASGSGISDALEPPRISANPLRAVQSTSLGVVRIAACHRPVIFFLFASAPVPFEYLVLAAMD